jgi:hypothetical protein
MSYVFGTVTASIRNLGIKIADAGKDYKSHQTYFPRYQPFIDAGTKDFQVRLTSTFSVTK